MKPIIGIVGRSDETEDHYNAICIWDRLRKTTIKKGGLPLGLMPTQPIIYEEVTPRDTPKLTSEEKGDLMRLVDMCDGIIIPGGTKSYEYDRFIYTYAKDKDIPILGLCAGMQLIGMVDNPEKRILFANETEMNHHQRGVKEVHSVKIIENTKLYNILGKSNIMVNSRHNYSVTEVNNLLISAYSSDGLIEGVEVKDKKFVLGVQWHPEDMIEYSESANKIFEAFINACRRN